MLSRDRAPQRLFQVALIQKRLVSEKIFSCAVSGDASLMQNNGSPAHVQNQLKIMGGDDFRVGKGF